MKFVEKHFDFFSKSSKKSLKFVSCRSHSADGSKKDVQRISTASEAFAHPHTNANM